ncbi:permease for cytosine/purines, uracil, thiamine, allantoin-domain-containing protein [Ilyonectria robusta]|uniref:permease for cytosine/purines, uracil, thiamine, allantoin-domain-containing protein n=1 Tax=Ilyonectria robusta TaxID=1079257 RepID=UPI001E8D01A4|nr:permease for cytosine/purines, uracil, thiamine, allantoin-domain-containing protein [Ilyonectria robusta]KAH8658531.1 permease for cytosine/purines, uracil, thiamine, allantoin-domain-containing protein [Ilyonectria robusta]
MSSTEKQDVEAGNVDESLPPQGDIDHGEIREVKRAREIQNSIGFLRALRKSEEWLDKKLGVETQGIERIPEEEKQPPSIWNIFFMWWSLNTHVGTLALGILGPEFGLSLRQSIASAVIGIVLGALTTSYTGTLGPKLGMRQIATSRYSFGFWGAKVCSVLNILVGGGFGVVNYVVVGQVLSAVSDYKMSITVGIVIIAIVSYVVSIFGFKIIHTFEKYSWIYTFIIFCVLLAQATPHVDADLKGEDGSSGLLYAGTFLTILAINFSNSSGWCSIAADYYCNFPATIPSWKVFFLTFWGIVIPTTFTITVGSCISNAALSAAYPPYADAYSNHGLGGLIAEIYHPRGWSKFCLVLLTFSVLGNNIAINYSSGLSLQLLGHHFHAVPRFIWSFVFAIVVAVLAIAGQENLSAVVNDFVSLLGYWTVSFTFILLIEDRVFRRHEGYNLMAWDQPNKLPWGLAAVTALIAAYCGGGVPGMSQTWFVGPIAAKFGGDGGDVGIYMSAAITIVWYPIARYFEKKYTGK